MHQVTLTHETSLRVTLESPAGTFGADVRAHLAPFQYAAIGRVAEVVEE